MSVHLSDTGSQSAQLATLTSPDAASGRTVLDGAFAVLDALADADDGLGLTALARASGLAKSSTHRLAEQLVTLGAVERLLNHRYFVGPRMMRIGQRWQPEPVLRRCAQRPVHALAVKSRAMASLRILHESRLRYICASVPHGHACMPDHIDPESIARTATGRVLYAAQPPGEVALPDCWTRREWRELRTSLADPRATVIDHQDAVPGICCASVPVWWPDGTCAGAVTVSVHAKDLPVELPIILRHTASRISAVLRQLDPTCSTHDCGSVGPLSGPHSFQSTSIDAKCCLNDSPTTCTSDEVTSKDGNNDDNDRPAAHDERACQ